MACTVNTTIAGCKGQRQNVGKLDWGWRRRRPWIWNETNEFDNGKLSTFFVRTRSLDRRTIIVTITK